MVLILCPCKGICKVAKKGRKSEREREKEREVKGSEKEKKVNCENGEKAS